MWTILHEYLQPRCPTVSGTRLVLGLKLIDKILAVFFFLRCHAMKYSLEKGNKTNISFFACNAIIK